MDVWHETEQSHENAKANGHREANDGETDAEEDAYTQRHQPLSADVAIELTFNVVHERTPEGSILLREHAYESL